VRRTSWPGRMERLSHHGVDWILDVAHNPAGAWSLRSGLRDALGDEDERPKVIVFSCLRDKPVTELAQILFPLFKQVIFAPIHSPRATPAEDLLAAASTTGTPASMAGSVAEALDLARRNVNTEENEAAGVPVIVVSGSVYLVGEARSLLFGEHKENII